MQFSDKPHLTIVASLIPTSSLQLSLSAEHPSHLQDRLKLFVPGGYFGVSAVLYKPSSRSRNFYRPIALIVTQLTASKH